MAIVKWKATPATDIVADALIALIMHAQSSAAAIRLSSTPCRHGSQVVNDSEVDGEGDVQMNDVSLTENRLRLIADTLKDQFENVEVVYEGNSASYEIKTDTSLTPGIIQENEHLTCTVNVSFPDDSGGIAEIRVECLDELLAANIQECIRNLTRFAAPLR